MKKLSFLLIFLLITIPCYASYFTTGGPFSDSNNTLPHSTTLPTNCLEGQVYYDTDATSGQQLYICNDSNTWVLQSGSFNPTLYGTTTWGSGSGFPWTFNAGATDPVLTFASGAVTLSDSTFTIQGANSQVTFANNIYMNGDTARKLKIGSTGGTYNEDLLIDNDTTSNTIALSTTTGATIFDFGSFNMRTLGTSNWIGNVSIGTFTAPTNTVSAAGNVSIGTAYAIAQTAPSNGAIIQGNVGVGTFAPSTNFHVAGNARITGLVSCDTIDTDSTGLLACGTDSSGGADVWTDGGTNVFLTTTTDNVGIGTTTPLAMLEVENLGTQHSFLVNDSLLDVTPFVVTSAGNVGIGTHNPTSTFMFASSAPTTNFITMATASAPSMAIRADAQTTVDLLNIQGSAMTTGDVLDLSSSNSSGMSSSIIKAVNSGSAYAGTTALIQSTGTSGGGTALLAQSLGSSGSVVRFSDVSSDTTPFSIDVIGNVGVGTISPIAQLDIRFQTPTPPFQIGNSATDATGAFMIMTSTGNVGIATINPVAGLAVMNGNVGIGTWSPTTKLQVVGTVGATAFTGDGSALTGISAGGWTDNGTSVINTSTADQVAIGTTTPVAGAALTVLGSIAGGGSGPLSITGGNVGIGTFATPAVLLHVGNTAGSPTNVGASDMYIQNDLEVDGTLYTADDAYAAGWNGSTAVPTKNAVYDKIETLGAASGWTDGGTIIYNTTTSDSVGIGTTAANRLLHMHVETASGEPRILFSNTISGTTTNDGFQVGLNDDGNSDPNAILRQNENFDMQFWTNALQRMTVDAGGNVGIGTKEPEGALVVRTSTDDMGWTIQSAANQACNTTCASSCVMGFDLVAGLLACSSASADQCLCAGSN